MTTCWHPACFLCTCIQTSPCCVFVRVASISPPVSRYQTSSSTLRLSWWLLTEPYQDTAVERNGDFTGRFNTEQYDKLALKKKQKNNTTGLCSKEKKKQQKLVCVHIQEKTQVQEKEIKEPKGWRSPIDNVTFLHVILKLSRSVLHSASKITMATIFCLLFRWMHSSSV